MAVLVKPERYGGTRQSTHGEVDILLDQWIDVGRMEAWRYNSPCLSERFTQDVPRIRQEFQAFAHIALSKTQMNLYQTSPTMILRSARIWFARIRLAPECSLSVVLSGAAGACCCILVQYGPGTRFRVGLKAKIDL